jgi:ATP-dependent RNA helicase DDX10/DBP4
MFERKNQSVLSEHYGKHLDHSIPEDEDEDFFSLKRIDHALDDGAGSPQTNAVSKRQIKIGESKKAMAKYQSKGTKLVFDDDGEAHQLYEVKDDEEFRKGDVREAGRQFVEQERGKLKDADVVDKELARDKRKEKKRKRKAKQHAVRLRFHGVYSSFVHTLTSLLIRRATVMSKARQ